MASPSVTYNFSNGATADADQVDQNFADIIAGITDGTKDLNFNALTLAGAATFNGHVTVGSSGSDDLTVNGSLASSVPLKTTNAFDIGSSTKGLQYAYFGSSAGSNTTKIGGSAVVADTTITLPSFTCTLAAQMGVRTETDNYTAALTDGFIRMNCASSKTLTLPAASTASQKIYTVQKADSSLSVLITIDANGSETINGATTIQLSTQYETVTIYCDGSNWHILDRKVNTVWTSYTPTFTGLGTVGAISCYWRREGPDCLVRARYTLGTPTSTEARVSLPSGLTSVSTIATLEYAGGPSPRSESSSVPPIILLEASVTYFTKGQFNGTSLQKRNGDTFGGSVTWSWTARAPIAGWEV